MRRYAPAPRPAAPRSSPHAAPHPAPHLALQVAHVARGALQTAWFYKWNVQMRIRPEVLAQRFVLCSRDAALCETMGLKDGYDLIPKAVKDLISQHNNCELLEKKSDCNKENLYLALQYPEGSPTHPSWPSGHAVVAGACVTVIKAMLATVDPDGLRKPWPHKKCPAMMATADGSELIADSSAEEDGVTIVGELHKLASNVALGRNMAGVHFRTDGDGPLHPHPPRSTPHPASLMAPFVPGRAIRGASLCPRASASSRATRLPRGRGHPPRRGICADAPAAELADRRTQGATQLAPPLQV